jgi:hypothetical protein
VKGSSREHEPRNVRSALKSASRAPDPYLLVKADETRL